MTAGPCLRLRASWTTTRPRRTAIASPSPTTRGTRALAFGGDLATTVAFLRDLARGGPALELGIGTGRVALPLHESGIEVHGIDASEAMIGAPALEARGHDISVTIADFRTFELEQRFGLVYVVFNTFFGLLAQDDQVECFARSRAHLEPGGAFAMEAFVPDLSRFDRGQRVRRSTSAIDEAHLEVSIHDPSTNAPSPSTSCCERTASRLFPVRVRYAYLSELDLMARLAGLRLRERWARLGSLAAHTGAQKHVSVWERA